MIQEMVFTKRISLGLSAQVFDPMGLVVGFMVKFKLQMREITKLELDWDQPLPEELQQEWRRLVTEAVHTEEVKFPRAIVHPNRVGNCELVGYWDGSDGAYGGMVLSLIHI